MSRDTAGAALVFAFALAGPQQSHGVGSELHASDDPYHLIAILTSERSRPLYVVARIPTSFLLLLFASNRCFRSSGFQLIDSV